jgi:CheY-like chemotaxis protein
MLPADMQGASQDKEVEAESFVALVVDDVRPTRKLVARVLKRRCGVTQVLQAANGLEALQVYTKATASGLEIDLITMDVQMPVMGGLEATRAIRAAGYEGLIVGLTGNALMEDVAQLKDAGADEVCTKPVDPKLLQHVVGLHIQLD